MEPLPAVVIQDGDTVKFFKEGEAKPYQTLKQVKKPDGQLELVIVTEVPPEVPEDA